MAVTLIEGFDYYNSSASPLGLYGGGYATINTPAQTITLAAGRFGGQCIGYSSDAGSYPGVRRPLTAAQTAGTLGFAFKAGVMPNSAQDANVIPFIQLQSATNYQIGLKIKNDGSVVAYRLTAANAGTVLGTSAASVVVVNTWHYIEWSFTIHDSTGTLTVKVDGAAVLTLTGQDTNNSGGNVDYVCFAQTPVGSSQGGTYYFDDVYMVDTFASLGERRVETLRPSADTAVKNFTPNSGSTNYSRVNETVVDGDTTYVESGTVGAQDLYDIGALSSVPATIDAIQLVGYARKTDASTRSYYLSLKSGATGQDGSAATLSTSYGVARRIVATNPDTALAWDYAAVDALQIGPKVAS